MTIARILDPVESNLLATCPYLTQIQKFKAYISIVMEQIASTSVELHHVGDVRPVFDLPLIISELQVGSVYCTYFLTP